MINRLKASNSPSSYTTEPKDITLCSVAGTDPAIGVSPYISSIHLTAGIVSVPEKDRRCAAPEAAAASNPHIPLIEKS